MLEKMKKFARIGTVVAVTLMGTPADAHAESADKGLEQQTQQQETQEHKFETLRVKNENILNNELKSRGLHSVKIGKPANNEHTRCSTDFDFGVYAEDGKALFDQRCIHDVFSNHYKFLDLVLEKTSVFLKAKDEGKDPYGEWEDYKFDHHIRALD